jgi:hypothetical protein
MSLSPHDEDDALALENMIALIVAASKKMHFFISGGERESHEEKWKM